VLQYRHINKEGAAMMELILAFLAGMIVMDFMYAWRMGIPQMLWYRFKNRNNPQPNFDQE
jgi:hypothetical protein